MNIIKQIKLPYYIYKYYMFKKACDDEMYLVCPISQDNHSHFRTTLIDDGPTLYINYDNRDIIVHMSGSYIMFKVCLGQNKFIKNRKKIEWHYYLYKRNKDFDYIDYTKNYGLFCEHYKYYNDRSYGLMVMDSYSILLYYGLSNYIYSSFILWNNTITNSIIYGIISSIIVIIISKVIS